MSTNAAVDYILVATVKRMSSNAAVGYIILATVTHPLLVDHQTAVPHPPVSQELGDNLHLHTNNLMSTCWL